jgi:hypothetical protein
MLESMTQILKKMWLDGFPGRVLDIQKIWILNQKIDQNTEASVLLTKS